MKSQPLTELDSFTINEALLEKCGKWVKWLTTSAPPLTPNDLAVQSLSQQTDFLLFYLLNFNL